MRLVGLWHVCYGLIWKQGSSAMWFCLWGDIRFISTQYPVPSKVLVPRPLINQKQYPVMPQISPQQYLVKCVARGPTSNQQQYPVWVCQPHMWIWITVGLRFNEDRCTTVYSQLNMKQTSYRIDNAVPVSATWSDSHVHRPRHVRNVRFLLWCIQYSFGIVEFSTTNMPQSHLFNKNIISKPSGSSSWYQNIPIRQKLVSWVKITAQIFFNQTSLVASMVCVGLAWFRRE
jgi:hypothetical protein